MSLLWLNNGFICKELYGPFVLGKDIEYKKDLSKKYSIVLNQAIKAGADEESIRIIKKYKDKIIEAINCYYRADIAKCNIIIKNLIKDVGENPFAVSALNNSFAFPGPYDKELQLFRCRLGDPSKTYSANEMLFLRKKCAQRLAITDSVFQVIQVFIWQIHLMDGGSKPDFRQKQVSMCRRLFLMDNRGY